MRTLTLLSAILLVALQTWTEPLQARTDEMPATAQEQPGTDDQDFAISFTRDISSGFRASGESHQHCRNIRLSFFQTPLWDCTNSGICCLCCCL
uniref:Alpha-defensin N-terminal domain-containing protein n=1 Tax=Piliocolobus tephrosceles TaxID=591936 RepID=A0A8C9GWF0_9PRIM